MIPAAKIASLREAAQAAEHEIGPHWGYIALANPTTMLALLAEREKLLAGVRLLREWDRPIIPIEKAGTGIWRNDWNERRVDYLAAVTP